MSGAIENFWETIDGIYGAYLDANAGLHAFRTKIVEVQAQVSKEMKIPLAKLDELAFFYTKGDPNDPQAIFVHQTTQGQLKQRNRKNGENELFLGGMCLVAIYQFWEDKFRAEIATELSINKEELKHDVMGDIRLMRHAIIHHRGVADDRISCCRCFRWFKPGDRILINKGRMQEIIFRLRGACDEWLAARK